MVVFIHFVFIHVSFAFQVWRALAMVDSCGIPKFLGDFHNHFCPKMRPKEIFDGICLP